MSTVPTLTLNNKSTSPICYTSIINSNSNYTTCLAAGATDGFVGFNPTDTIIVVAPSGATPFVIRSTAPGLSTINVLSPTQAQGLDSTGANLNVSNISVSNTGSAAGGSNLRQIIVEQTSSTSIWGWIIFIILVAIIIWAIYNFSRSRAVPF